jgi:quinol monooxygenase YgiN
MLNIAAMLKAAEGKGDALEQEFKKYVPKFRSDPGTLVYIVHRGLDDPDKFFVYEKYESNDAAKAHSSAPHFKEFSRATASLVAGRPEVGLYREIA